MVRAKFRVHSVTHHEGESRTVALGAVSGDENKTWSKWTPSGSLSINITNPEAFDQFKPGDIFFLDFTPAPATEAGEKAGTP
jgi:hypothetical protein